jgi:alkaline phosphatase
MGESLELRRPRRLFWRAALAVVVGVGLLPVSTPPAPAQQQTTLVAAGSSWRYDDTGTARFTGWRGVGFDDSAWKQGRAELGYGDGDEATTVSFGPDPTAKYVTTYFRRAFDVAEPATVSSLLLELKRDDGAVVYLNGTEVYRTNMPTGTVSASTYALDWSTSETTWFTARPSPSLLRSGRNVIAVEVHQASRTSSDISMNLRLVATTGTPAATLMMAGDVGHCSARVAPYTGAEVSRRQGTWAPLGDLAYPDGSATDFANCYTPFFSTVLDRTRPAIGNHEYRTNAGGPYWDIFGSRAGARGDGWYSYQLGGWHIVVLNSNCGIVACGTTSRQYRWLVADLAAKSSNCVLAYWHHAPFSSDARGASPGAMLPMLQLLEQNGLDLVVAGHFHNYERFARMNSSGAVDSRGFRTFVAGIGGVPQDGFGTPRTGSELRYAGTFGFVQFTLRPDGYGWELVTTGGTARTDTGTGTC